MIPLAALVLLGLTVYCNLEFTAASGPGFWDPVVAGNWVAPGIAFAVALPGVARQVGARLRRDAGLTAAGDQTAGDQPVARTAGGQESVVSE